MQTAKITRMGEQNERMFGFEKLDVPFDFNNQLSYPADSVLHPGDRLLTTCRFQNDGDRVVMEGESSDNEMCVNFMTAWPAGSLNNGRNKNSVPGCSQ